MTEGALHDTRYSWIRLAITLLIACIGNVGMWAVIVVMPSMQAEFGIDRATASVPYTGCMAGFAFGSLLIGRWVDRIGITWCLASAGIVAAVGFYLASLSQTVQVITGFHVLIGFSAAASFAPLMADISHWFLKHRGIAVAITASGNYLSGAFWPQILADILETGGWRLTYGVLAGILLVTMLPLSLALRPKVPVAAKRVADGAAARRAQSVALPPSLLIGLLFVAGIACCVAMSMPQVHIVALCVDLGFGPAVGAEMLSLMLLGGVVSRLISGALADRIGGVRTLLIGAALQGIALYFYLGAGDLVSLYVVSAIFGLSQGGIVPSYSIIVREYLPTARAGATVGLLTFATIVGMAFGGWISGVLYDLSGSYRLAILNGLAWNALNVGIVGLILWRARMVRAHS
jgi:MFS family permease